MVVIDGSSGEGGGQILRTALAVAMVTGQPFRIKDIRAKRKKPGLLRSHLAVIDVAAQLCSAGFDGTGLGSSQLTFFPGDVVPGQYKFSVPATVAASLVLETLLPVLCLAKGESTVVIEGGFNNAATPPAEFLAKTYLPQISKMGPTTKLRLESAPELPLGVGRFVLTVEPTVRFKAISLMDRGVPMQKSASRALTGLGGHRKADEVDALERTLGMAKQSLKGDPQLRTSKVMLEMSYESITEVFTAFGKAGQTNEALAAEAAKQAKRYMESPAAVCEFLADQLLLPMALAGSGSMSTTRVSPHARANMDTIRAFLGVEFWTDPLGKNAAMIEVKQSPM